MLTPEERTLRARIAAYEMHAQHDARATTAKARATHRAGFEDRVDPDRVLPEAERRRRAEAAYRAHMARLAFKSAQARRKRKEQREAS